MTGVTVRHVARQKEPNPNVGPWLKAQRGKRKQDTVVAELAERGVEIGRSWLSRAENGAPVSDELLRAFESYYGSVAPPFEPPMPSSGGTGAEMDALVTALADYTRAVDDLVSLARPLIVSQQKIEARLRSLEAAAKLQAQSDAEGRRGRPTPQQKAG